MPRDVYGLTLQGALEKNRAERPTAPFILGHDGALTYADAARLVAGFAHFLQSSGVGPGDRVAMVLPRVPELVLCFLGAVRIGAVPVPVNYTAGAEAVRRFVAAVSPAAAVVHARLLRQHHLEPWQPGGRATVVVGGEIAGCTPWDAACVASGGDLRGGSDYGEVAYLNYTTGSTGMPKGAVATHANIAGNTRSAVEAFGITREDVHLCMFASFAHPHELFARALYTGGAIALLEEISPKTIARTIKDRGVTCMMGLAPMYDMLISHCADAGLGGLRVAESGGMYTRPDIIENFRRHFGIPVLSVWGSTETTGIALANTPAQFRTDGSAGRACPSCEARVVDEEGREAADGEVGELVISGPGVVSGYREDVPFASVDGWYHTGDLAYRDGEGYHYFVERKSGLLKVAGTKVYPLQVELVLQSHPCVKEAAVIGVQDRLRGVVPKAFLIVKEGCRVDADELRRFCRGRLADLMIPREVQTVADFPRIGSGKVDKGSLKRISA